MATKKTEEKKTDDTNTEDKNVLDKKDKDGHENSLAGKDAKNAEKAEKGSKVKPAAKSTKKEDREIPKIKPGEFNLMKAAVRQFNAIAPVGVTKEDLEHQDLWAHVAPKISLADEIRVWAEDGSYVAYLVVTFRHANVVRTKITGFHKLEEVSYEAAAELDRYQVKQRGVKKWCLIDTKDGSVLRELIPTQAEAFKARDEFLQALAR